MVIKDKLERDCKMKMDGQKSLFQELREKINE